MFAADYEARLLEPSDIADHMPFLYDQARGHQVIELGVRSGNSTAAFLAAVEKEGGHVWSVDVAWPNVPETWADSELWDFVYGDDLTVDQFLPDQVDVVFIDTLHTYAHTLQELAVYSHKVRPGGVILLHDTELEHAPSEPGDEPYPVQRAVKVFAAFHEWPVEFHEGCYGLGILHKP